MIFKQAIQGLIFDTIKNATQELGQDSFVIGGYVRDFLLKRNQKKDIDIVTIGDGILLAEKVATLLPTKPKVQVFKNFGTAMLKFNDVEIEFVGARKESYHFTSRKPQVDIGTLEDDQNRRDFTINALAISLNEKNYGELIDPFNGLKDLENKIIKTPLEPTITYSDDPLRMLRAIRFANQLNFEIEKESLRAIKSNKERLTIISGERIVEELHKILQTSKPSIGLLYLYKTELLDIILPELIALNQVEEIEGQTHKNNFYHTLEVVDNICKTTDDLWLRWSALLHDIGKAPTKKYVPNIGWTFHGHEYLGSKMILKIFKRLHMPLNQKLKFVQKMVAMSSRPIVISQEIVTDSAVRRLVFDAGEDIDSLMKLCAADITTKNTKRFKKYHQNFELVKQKIIEVEEKDRIRNFQPPISGEEIMELFNLLPSKEVGILKEAVKEAILEGDIKNEYDDALKLLINKASKMGIKPIINT